ncbi:low affinity immunoglobulin gamma Fc region receptor II-c-like isoform X2 [Xiphias gladius]|uniref:low affinity immunoglobulin gamma Fc region receptor II-c-like isoform X2 n=1 Tax=Xiphias gladius TaxID=8245 RepID=UPI001A984102|nr:low affinity immunoglobulin gamma Fc region receptor II-c-like isoform X2 [Xiphias gladius]
MNKTCRQARADRMEVAALCLILYLEMNSLDSGQAVSLTVTPTRLQFFKYDSFSVSCEEEEEEQREEEEEERAGWRVMKKTKNREVLPCPFSCFISAAFPCTHSGVYWCETGPGTTTDTVNIVVTAGPVILESPVLPVAEGDRVTLRCRGLAVTSAGDLATDFFKDGLLVATSSTGNMTVDGVSTADDGLYKCSIAGYGASPESRLTVRAPPAGPDPPAPLRSPLTLLRHLVVGIPYLLSTVLLGLICRDRRRGHLEAAETSCQLPPSGRGNWGPTGRSPPAAPCRLRRSLHHDDGGSSQRDPGL